MTDTKTAISTITVHEEEGYFVTVNNTGKFTVGSELPRHKPSVHDSLADALHSIEQRKAAKLNAKKVKVSIPVILVLRGQYRADPKTAHATFTGVDRRTGEPMFNKRLNGIVYVVPANRPEHAENLVKVLKVRRELDRLESESTYSSYRSRGSKQGSGVTFREMTISTYRRGPVEMERANEHVKKYAELLSRKPEKQGS